MSAMALSCHGPGMVHRTRAGPTVALVGNPNVGKSTVFNRLTGLHALTTHYPGTTVEVAGAPVVLAGLEVHVIDLPGTYGLSASSEDQRVTWDALLDDRPDAVLTIVDATNLTRNLYLVLQLIDLGFPVVVMLNLMDLAEQSGAVIDVAHLERLLGVPVIPSVATNGRGVAEAASVALRSLGVPAQRPYRYAADLEHAVDELMANLDDDVAAQRDRRPTAFLLLEQPGRNDPPEHLRRHAAEISDRLTQRVGESAAVYLGRQRHVLAERIAGKVSVAPSEMRGRRMWYAATRPATGIPLLALVLAIIFAGLFWGGSLLATALDRLWATYASPIVVAVITRLFGAGPLAKTLLWALDAGLNAVLSIGVPYVLTFYLVLAVLEDTGYLTAASILLDRTLGKLGLTGRAAIPLVAGAGCNVPAIIGLRTLRTDRERLIAGTLVTLVPCSARTAVIFGAVARFLGWQWALLLYGIVTGVILAAGWGLNRFIPGHSPALLMEVFPFRMPGLRTVVRKTWFRIREFAGVAVPIVLGGSVVLGALYETGLIRAASRPLAPVVEGWLGLPAVAGLTLVFAVLRKELALQLLVVLATAQFGRGANNLLSFMTGHQLFTYALVNTIYIPCVATIAVLGRSLGWRRAVVISAGTITLAVLVGGIVMRLLRLV